MTTRRWIVVGVLAGCTVNAVTAVAAYYGYQGLYPTAGPTLANFDRLREGMTMDAVEQIIGGDTDRAALLLAGLLEDRQARVMTRHSDRTTGLTISVRYRGGIATGGIAHQGGKLVRRAFRPRPPCGMHHWAVWSRPRVTSGG